MLFGLGVLAPGFQDFLGDEFRAGATQIGENCENVEAFVGDVDT
jgi:hypothetical protein